MYFSIILLFFATENIFAFFNKKSFNYFLIDKKLNSYEDRYIEYLEKYNKLETFQKSDNLFSSFLFKINKKSKINKEKFKIFKKNYKFINNKNKELENNSFTLGTNFFFDEISYENISNNVMQEIIPKNYTFENKYKKFLNNPWRFMNQISQLEREFNWNNSIYLSPVKQQGTCGSCWAFSTTNSLETFMRKNGYNVTRLSEQELVDCSKENRGCNGGFMHKAFDFIIENKGLSSNDDYPYIGLTNDCKKEDCNINGNISKNVNITNVKGSELLSYEFNVPESILDRVISLKISPLCIAVDASSIYFQYYKSGIIDIELNETQHLNHAVLLIGYGIDDNGLYWIIQNSWGKYWGEDGFCRIRVKKGEGILLSNLYGVYPTKIRPI